MPYIKQERRLRLMSTLEPLCEWVRDNATPGDLNYLMTVLANDYAHAGGLSYQRINDVMGVFSSAAAEFYRKVAVPYEHKKEAENGGVYD